MVNPIFGTDVSGVQYLQEYAEGVFATGTYRFIAPQLRSTWQVQFAPYPVQALGSPDIADFNVSSRVDASVFTFDLTASGVAYLKDACNLGASGVAGSGTYWSHSYVGRCYSDDYGGVINWRVSGARIDNVTVGPGAGAWKVMTSIVHKPPTITGAALATGIYMTEWPGAVADPVLNPDTVTSGSLFTWNASAWYLADAGFRVDSNVVPIRVLGEQNMTKYERTVRDITVMVAPYEGNLQTYIPALNTVGTGVMTFATGRTATFGGLYWHGLTQLAFDPARPAVVGLRGTARTLSIAG